MSLCRAVFFGLAILLPAFCLAVPLRGEVLSIAHRGNSLFAPENTLSAFAAAEGNAELVEFDVRVSSDGILVLMHDGTVDRTTDGVGSVSGKTLAQLKLLDAGSWFAPAFGGERVPTLEEAIAAISAHSTPLIEHKAGSAAQYVNELRRLNAVTNVVLQSFDWNFLTAVHALEPAIPLAALGSGALTAATLSAITNAGARTVAWEKAGITATEVALVHDAGLGLFVWTVDGPAIQTYLDLGVDGIISNDPALVKSLQETNTITLPYLGDQLITYWKMDDGLTNPWSDIVSDSQGAAAGMLVRNDGQSHWFGPATARLGGCFQAAGDNAFILFPTNATLDINTNALSMSAWVWLTLLPSQIPMSFAAIFDSTTDCYVLYLDKANKELRFKVTDSNGHAARPGIPESLLQTNQWIHVAATFSGAAGPVSGQATIYLNGQARDVHSGHDGNSPFGLTGNVKAGQFASIGREGPTGGNFFTGLVDDWALWKRALKPAEIQRVFEKGQAGKSLQDLLREPTPLIQVSSVQLTPSGAELRINFQNNGPWQSFQLHAAASPGGPYVLIDGLAPTDLGNGQFRFDYALEGESEVFFKIQGHQ